MTKADIARLKRTCG